MSVEGIGLRSNVFLSGLEEWLEDGAGIVEIVVNNVNEVARIHKLGDDLGRG